MAYVLTSFVKILEQDQYHLILDMKPQIDPLLEKTRFLRDLFVENSYSISCTEKEILESRMRDVVHKAEDLIESHIRDQVGTSQIELTAVMEGFDSINKELLKLVSFGNVQADDPLLQSLKIASSTELDPSFCKHDLKEGLVGFEDEIYKVIHKIREGSSKLETMSIAGMAGQGKTTLAYKIYYDQGIGYEYDTRVWVTISEEYNVQAILLALLDGLGKRITNEMRLEKSNKLGELVRNTLKGRKYLVVLDDVWDLEAWDEIIRFFPNDGRSSRILITTRFREVAEHVSPAHPPFQIRFLTCEESTHLLLIRVFGKLDCPFEFDLIGRRIAETCHGHPLAIILVAGLLATSEKTLIFWELVLENLFVLQQPYFDILYIKSIILMCYNHLSHYLKPCLLYVGAFPEDYETSVSKIIKLWIAEGLVEPIAGKSLEDTAEVYLRGLVDKNFLVCRQQDPTGRIRTFVIHDLLREFCQKEAIEKEFLWYKYLNGVHIQKNEKLMRRVSLSPLSQPGHEMKLMPLVRSFLCIGRVPLRLAPKFVGLSLLRVLDVFELEYYQFPMEILQLVLLRYLAFSCHSNLPASISRLQNLQTLIIRRLPSFRAFSLPSELWELAQLRHVKSKETCTCYFPTNENNYFIQENLQTLSNVQMVGLTNEFLGKFPNIRKLGLFGNITMDNVIDLAFLHNLEKLKCSSDWSLAARNFLSFLTFPPSLKKLTLRFCKIPLGFMATIGSLPNLEQLKLQKSDFLGPLEPEWVPTEGDFASLILLQMEDLNLVHWKANSTHFPRLEHLIIQRCCSMAHISKDIGNIPTIQKIKVDKCSPSLLDSVMQLEQELGSRGIIRPVRITIT